MRIAYLGDPNNIHVRRWIKHFSVRHTCALFCDPPVLKPIEGVEIICPPMSLLRKATAFKLIRHRYSNNFFKAAPFADFISHWAPDLVHGFEALEYGYATAACHRFPTLLTPFGNDLFDWPKQSIIARLLVKRSLHRVHSVTTNAPGLETYLEKEFGIHPEKVECFSWGVDCEVFHAEHTDEARLFAKRYGLPDHARIILSPRKTKPYWGTELIAEAVPEIVRRLGSDVVLVFLRSGGDAAFEAQMKVKVEEAGCAENTRFIADSLSPSEMAAVFNLADVFVSVPRTDLLSSTVLEGMACGCVPILADLPYYRSVVEDGENGFYVKSRTSEALAEAVENAFLQDTNLKKMSVRNVELVREKHDWNSATAQMEALYRKLAVKRKF